MTQCVSQDGWKQNGMGRLELRMFDKNFTSALPWFGKDGEIQYSGTFLIVYPSVQKQVIRVKNSWGLPPHALESLAKDWKVSAQLNIH